ncbi:T9SS type A sorting domain-containing protein [Rufibacter sp. LB8]|uniref:T9SS type A sorting domain-containing protein n=1 Tax=Rufibacter sp. LB8 TaxID=2777781 RepID=UPI00178C4469|nr:T9SS type A sorting domain-containing protein [Rufibacter sp. LB8]
MTLRCTYPGLPATRVSFCLLLALCLLWANGAALAQETCSLLPLSLEDRAQAATAIVEGKVTSQRSFWDSRHENIYTASQVTVYKVFKGANVPQNVEIITEGGQVDLDLHVYSATLMLKDQQHGVFFLQPHRKNQRSYAVFASLQGFIEYRLPQGSARDPFTAYPTITGHVYPALQRLTGATYRTLRTNPDIEALSKPKTQNAALRRAIPAIINFTPLSLRAGTGDVLTINGTNFGLTRGNGFVEFPNADDGGKTFIKPLPTDYVSWTDNQIKVKVPTSGIEGGTAGTGAFRVVNNDPNTATAPLPLTIVFAVSNVGYKDDKRGLVEQSYQPRLIDQNGMGGYTFQFGTSFVANQPALYAFKRSMNEWSCNTYINWDADSKRRVNTTADDGVNSVRFANTGELPGNVLGRCISRYKGCISGTVLTFWVDEIDLEFAQRADWQYGPARATSQQFDFESVVLHELGHGHQLSHLILPRAVMHYAVARAQDSRTLNAENDIAGGNYVMNLSTGSDFCDVEAMERKPTNQCAILVESLNLTGTFQPTTNTVLLTWTTPSENNLTDFVVERSKDGKNYTEIGTVPATGTSATPRSYQFVDPEPLLFAYYRLQLRMADGTLVFSEVAEVAGPGFEVLLAPNPGGNRTAFFYNSPVSDELQMEIYDLSGKRYARFTLLVEPQVSRYELNLPGLAGKGLYLIRYQGKNGEGVLKYFKAE